MFLKKVIILCLVIGVYSCGSSKYQSSTNKSKTSDSVSKAYYEESSGLTMDEAVVIHASNSMEGIPLEYQFVAKKEGKRGVDWNLVQQSLQQNNDKSYDVLVINLTKNNEEKTYYFDITNFFGKF